MTLKRWLPLLVVILLLGLLIQSTFLVSLVMTLGVVLSLSNWWRKQALSRVYYRRKFQYIRAFPGEHHPLRVEIENRKFLPLSWLRIQDPWPKAVAPDDDELLAPSHIPGEGFLTHVFSLRWFERTRRDYLIHFRRRGAYKIGPAKAFSGDPFGIFEQAAVISPLERLTVFPALTPLEKLDLPPENPFGDMKSRRKLFEDPNRPMGVREYHPEDGFRRVHWPATARTGQLQVKVYQPTSAEVMVLCLNVSTSPRYWEGFYPEILERLLSVSATLVTQGFERGFRVGLISNGCLSNSDQPFRIPPGRSPNQLAHLLEALAGVTPVVVAPFSSYLLKEIPRVSYGASLLILTAIVNQELSETLLRIKQHERSITLFSLSEDIPPYLPGIKTVHLPFHTEDSDNKNSPDTWSATMIPGDYPRNQLIA